MRKALFCGVDRVPTGSGWGRVLLSQTEGTEAQIRRDDCTKAPSAFDAGTIVRKNGKLLQSQRGFGIR